MALTGDRGTWRSTWGSAWSRYVSFGTGIVLMLAAYGLVSAAVVAVILLQLRSDTIAASYNVLTAFAQLSDEQTTRTFQNVEEALETVEAALVAMPHSGVDGTNDVQDDLRRLIASRPFLRSITVLDARGRAVFSSESAIPGMELSDRAYFVESRDKPRARFQIGVPIRARTTQEWILPVTLGLRGAGGEFAGVIVASVNPLFFDRVWTVEKTIKGQATALWTAGGAMVMRSPFVEKAMGAATFSPELMRRTNAGSIEGTFAIVSNVDGERRLLAYRRLAAFPGFIISVTQALDQALAPWRHIARLAAAGWAVSLATLGALAVWLVVEWNARHAERDRYQTLFDANAYPMAVIDRDTRRFLAVNDAALQQYGWSRAEALSMRADDLYLPEDVHHQRPAVRPGSEVDRARSVSGHRHHTKDGTIIDVEMQARPIRFGDVRATLVITRNVTEQVRAERARQVGLEELRQSQERYRTLFEAAPYAVIVSDRDSLRLLAVNAAAVNLYGGTRDQMLGMTADDFYLPEDRAALPARRAGYSADVTRHFTGIRHRKCDGTTVFVDMAVRFIDYQGRSAALTIVADISERLRLEEVREATEDQLRQAQKMEVVGQLTGGIAHDFNNLLTVILANADEVQEEVGLEPRVKARLEQIAKAVLRASELTGQLLAFSRKQALNPKPTDLNELVVSTGKLLRRTLGANLELVVDLADDLWMVDIDRAQLETALINLCVNARDATPDGGKLLIRSENVAWNARALARIPDAEARDYVRLSVADTGTGMPPDVLAKVFEPFFTTKDVGKGSGLGLSMVYGFIRQSGGTVGIDSEVGRGTTISLYLPRSDRQAEVVQALPAPKMPGGSERLLLVEDELQVRLQVAEQLASLGYDVTEAADGTAAIAALEAATRPFDLMLTDVVMPGPLNGKALAEAAARRWPGTAVALMSGYAEGTEAVGTPDHVELLAKPFRKHDLAQFVRRVLDAGVRGPRAR
ncbi:MAG: PAS domain S-box protein [Reyranella sp.]|nr:PAS domain S-box protein [Reyranella sp.]